MKLADVKIGATYMTRVGAGLARVTVLGETTKLGYSCDGEASRPERTMFRVRNEKTGRELVRSPAALRDIPSSERVHVRTDHTTETGSSFATFREAVDYAKNNLSANPRITYKGRVYRLKQGAQ